MLSLIILSSMNNGIEMWYWEMKSPSGPAACFSPYYTCFEGAAQAARAFIFNMNYSGILLAKFDERITPTEDPARSNLPFEIYFKEIYKHAKPVPVAQEAYEAPESAIRKGHLSLVTDT